MRDSLLLIKLVGDEMGSSPELRYQLQATVGQARRTFGTVRLVETRDLHGVPLQGGEPFVLLVGSDAILISHASLDAMAARLDSEAVVAVPERLDRTGLGERYAPYSLRGFERAERAFLEGEGDRSKETDVFALPVSLWKRDALEQVVTGGRLELPLDGVVARAGLYHQFVDYYGEVRDDVLPLLPDRCDSVLEIGCARGLTSKLIKEQRSARVVGVEMNAAIAEEARRHLDDVHVGDVQTLEPRETFDVVLALELFEHLTEQERFLERATSWLNPGGSIILSVPNVGHYSVVEDLVAGRWDYLPIGLLCYTHYRFFTRRTLEDWLRSGGFDDYEIVAQKTSLPERAKTWPEGFDVDLESLATSGFYVVIRP